MVATAFIPNPNNLPEVGHKDELNFYNSDICNNTVDNLYWTTSKDNSNMPEHKERISCAHKGLHSGGKNPASRKVVCDGIIYDCVKDCAEHYGYKRRTMGAWLEGRNKMPNQFVALGLRYYDSKEKERDTWLGDMLKEGGG